MPVINSTVRAWAPASKCPRIKDEAEIRGCHRFARNLSSVNQESAHARGERRWRSRDNGHHADGPAHRSTIGRGDDVEARGKLIAKRYVSVAAVHSRADHDRPGLETRRHLDRQGARSGDPDYCGRFFHPHRKPVRIKTSKKTLLLEGL